LNHLRSKQIFTHKSLYIMKTIVKVLVLAVATFVTFPVLADNGSNGLKIKKNLTNVVAKLKATQKIWKYWDATPETVASQAIVGPEDPDVVMIVDNSLPTFQSLEEKLNFVKTNKKMVMLNWIVATSNPEATYVIERSVMGLENFIEIGKIEPSQRNLKASFLTFMDTEAPLGLYQYRVVEKVGNEIKTEYLPQAMAHFVARLND
jgi:hypothetical protein